MSLSKWLFHSRRLLSVGTAVPGGGDVDFGACCSLTDSVFADSISCSLVEDVYIFLCRCPTAASVSMSFDLHRARPRVTELSGQHYG